MTHMIFLVLVVSVCVCVCVSRVVEVAKQTNKKKSHKPLDIILPTLLIDARTQVASNELQLLASSVILDCISSTADNPDVAFHVTCTRDEQRTHGRNQNRNAPRALLMRSMLGECGQ